MLEVHAPEGPVAERATVRDPKSLSLVQRHISRRCGLEVHPAGPSVRVRVGPEGAKKLCADALALQTGTDSDDAQIVGSVGLRR